MFPFFKPATCNWTLKSRIALKKQAFFPLRDYLFFCQVLWNVFLEECFWNIAAAACKDFSLRTYALDDHVRVRAGIICKLITLCNALGAARCFFRDSKNCSHDCRLDLWDIMYVLGLQGNFSLYVISVLCICSSWSVTNKVIERFNITMEINCITPFIAMLHYVITMLWIMSLINAWRNLL